jgi:hypothetical protein
MHRILYRFYSRQTIAPLGDPLPAEDTHQQALAASNDPNPTATQPGQPMPISDPKI